MPRNDVQDIVAVNAEDARIVTHSPAGEIERAVRSSERAWNPAPLERPVRIGEMTLVSVQSTVQGILRDGNLPTRLGPPSKFLLWAEWRSVVEFGMAVASAPALMMAQRGDGHPVWVLPGFLTSDRSTTVLRSYLNGIGYQSHGWELGRNLGGVYSMRQKLRGRLAEIHAETGRKVSIVGWSLGGLYARDLAVAMPESVRCVITLGSPFSDMAASNANRLYESLSGERFSDMPVVDRDMLGGDLAVPTTAVYSKTDGIVNWRSCLLEENDSAENVRSAEVTLASASIRASSGSSPIVWHNAKGTSAASIRWDRSR